MTPFDAYVQYLAIKNHFSKLNYDYYKYGGKSKASISSFQKRKDKYWFERISRQKSDEEIKDYYIANFVESDTPDRLWIGEIIRDGEQKYQKWNKRKQSLSYIFKEESLEMLCGNKLDDLFECSNNHPIILKKFLSGKICLETFIIWDKIFLFRKKFDDKLIDPVWQSISLKIKKYSTFLNIDVCEYKKILRKILSEK